MAKRMKLYKKQRELRSSRDVLKDFTEIMPSPDKSGALYDTFKDPSRDGACCRGMRSFKRQRTDHDVVTTADVTDLTADSDSEESPLVLTPRGVSSPPQDVLPVCGWRGRGGGWSGGGRGGGWSEEGRGGGWSGGGRGGGWSEGGRGGGWSGGGRGGGWSEGGRGGGWSEGRRGGGWSERRRGGRGGRRGEGRWGETKISDFVSSVKRHDSKLEATPSSGSYSDRNVVFISSTESSLPPLQPQPSRKRLQLHRGPAMSSDTQCTVATMKYARQHPSVVEGSTDIVTSKDSPNMGKARNFEQRNARHSDNSCDDVFVIEPPPVETHSPYFAKTTESPTTTNHIWRSSGGGFDRHCRISLPPLRTTTVQETRTKAQFTDRCLGLEDDVVNLSSSHHDSKLTDASSVRSGSSQEREERRSIEDYSPVERVCYADQNKQSRVKVKDNHEDWVPSSSDSAGCNNEVVWVECEGDSVPDTTSVPAALTRNGCSIVGQQSNLSSSGVRGVGLQSSDALRRDPLRSTVTTSPSTNSVCLSVSSSVCLSVSPSVCNTPTSALASLRKCSDGFVESSRRRFVPVDSQRDTSHTVQGGCADRQKVDCISVSPGSPPGAQLQSLSAQDKTASVTGRLREEGRRQRSLLTDSDVSIVGDKSADSDDDFEEPKKKKRNPFAMGEKKEKTPIFAWKSNSSSTATPTHSPRKEKKGKGASSPSSRPKPEQRSVLQHLQHSQQQNPSPLHSLPPPPPLLTSISCTRTSSSDEEVVFQGEEGKKTYPLRNKRRDWYSEIAKEESSRTPQNKGRPGLPPKQPPVTNTRSFYGPQPHSYGMAMVKASQTKKKGVQPQGYVQSLSNIQAPRLKSATSNARRNVPSRPPIHGVLRDAEMDTVQVDIATVQIGRLTDVNVISLAELSSTDLKLCLDIEDKTHRAEIELKHIAEWKMNLSGEPLLITLKLREGPARMLASRLSNKFHLDAKFYNPFSGDESERFIILHVRDTPPPNTIVVLNEILDDAKTSSTLEMIVEKEFSPTEAAELLQRVKPSKMARPQHVKDPDFSIPSVGVDNNQAPRRSSRLKRGKGRNTIGEEVVRRKKGNPNKKLLAYKPAGSRVNLEIMESDLDCLYPGEYLNDKIIDFYLMYLYYELLAEEHRHRIHIFSSFFHTRLKDSSRDNHELSTPERIHDRVKTWTRHVDLFSKDYIVLPVCDRSHWFVAFICHPGLFDPDNQPTRSQTRPRKTPQTRSGSRRRSKRGRKPKTKTPVGAIVLSDSSQDEGELPGGEEDREAPLPGDGEGKGEDGGEVMVEDGRMKEEGGVERVEEEELLDATMEELRNWRDSCEEVVPGAMLQEAVEKEGEEEERVACVQTESPSTTLEGFDDSLEEVQDSQPEEILMEECESVMEVECGEGEEDGVETQAEEAPSVEVPNSQDAVTLIPADMDSQVQVESLGEEEKKDVTVCPSSSSTEEVTREPCIMVLDSLGVKRIGIVKRIRDYLTVEWRAKKHDLPPKLFDGMRASYPGVQLQDNSSDCGVFVLQYVESLLKSVKENRPLPSSPDAWASYEETNSKRTDIKSLITDFEKRRSQESKPSVS